MLSVVMIIKNESSVLEKTLKSIVELVDEIIIVDTGSQDDSKEIALKYTKKVFDYKWNNDFSAARNYAISKSSNDWVLILDADEIVIKLDKETVLNFCSNKDVVGRIKRENYFEDAMGTKKYIERVNRLFNKSVFQYEGIIHEQIVKKDKTIYSTQEIDIEVNHIGYTKEIISKTNKVNRNIDLLNEAIKNNPTDPYLIYQLGKGYFMGKEYLKAYESFKKALENIENFNYEYVEDLVECYGYSMLELKMYNESKILYNYEIYYKNTADYVFLIALIEMNNGNFQKAAEAFMRCTELESGKIEGVTTYLPLYNIGVIFQCLGNYENAEYYFNMCKDYAPAKERIREIYRGR